MRLVSLVVLLLPVGLALLVAYLGAPPAAAPAILLVCGAIWFLAAVRMVMGLAEEIGDEKKLPYDNALSSVDGAEMLDRRPLLFLIPILITAGWILILAGLVWLAFVNLIAAALVSITFATAYKLWPRPQGWKQPHTLRHLP